MLQFLTDFCATFAQSCTQIGVTPDAITSPFLLGADCALDVAESVTETLETDDPAAAAALSKRRLDALPEAWVEAS